MLRCSDGSFYVGSSSYDDVHLRVAEHNDARYSGYTSVRHPVTLIWSKRFDELRQAHVMERRLKGWSRAKKLALIDGNGEALVALSKRRAGKVKSTPRLSRRQLADELQSIGRRHPEVRARRGSHEG